MADDRPHPPNEPAPPDPPREPARAPARSRLWWPSSATEADRFISGALPTAAKVVAAVFIAALALFILMFIICSYDKPL